MHIDVTTRDGVADSYLAQGDGPGVLLIIDAFGLRPQIEQMADRIAGQGYTVLAPNLFYRVSRAPVFDLTGIDDPDRRDEVIGRVMPVARSLDRDQVVSDADAYLGQLGDGKVGIVGYCMGGRIGWRIATAAGERVAALGAFHTGGLVTDAPDSPHLSASELRAEVYLGHADNDRSNTPEQIAALERALDEAGVRHTTEVYAGAAHGYTMADTPAYDEAAAERHYRELFALLERAL
jgi:carboxymethylenebutenolidase